jgi:very-short-patch-repair endonuclease
MLVPIPMPGAHPMKAVRLTNRQLKARQRPNLNQEFADALNAAGVPVITLKEWSRWTPSESVRNGAHPFFVAEFPYAPSRPTYDYRKSAATIFEKARWRFEQIKPPRCWRWDFFSPPFRLAIELDGGSYIQGGHSRGAQSCRDYLKRNEAEIDGYLVLRFDAAMVRQGIALDFVLRALERPVPKAEGRLF